MSQKKNIGEAQLQGQPHNKLKFVIADGVITPEKLAPGCFDTDRIPDGAITSSKLAKGAVTLDKISSDISNSLLALVLEDVSIIWDKIADITGEQLQDLTFEVSPKYFISNEPIPVHISASSVGNNAMFDHIAFYINGLLICEYSGVETVEFDTEISDTSEIKYVASVMGTEYSASEVVVHYGSYWLGAGKNYEEIMDLPHIIPITEGLRGAYDVTFTEGDKLYIILGSSLRDQFIRADMNSFEIPFRETVVEIDGKSYNILESENAYQAGVYNIDING